ncbi:MAG TPA: toll/interleukin-1 receptor domain-containing protein, partial [Spirillospora sp.]|nr:toll/interleukin-1 receptor domain-containing protein [Spirillospora sp.]
MARVFISYSSKSKNKVQTLAQDLEMAGHQIWFDHKLTGGQAWWEQILEQIRQCDIFIFALTPDALDSYPCKLEYTYAHD